MLAELAAIVNAGAARFACAEGHRGADSLWRVFLAPGCRGLPGMDRLRYRSDFPGPPSRPRDLACCSRATPSAFFNSRQTWECEAGGSEWPFLPRFTCIRTTRVIWRHICDNRVLVRKTITLCNPACLCANAGEQCLCRGRREGQPAIACAEVGALRGVLKRRSFADTVGTHQVCYTHMKSDEALPLSHAGCRGRSRHPAAAVHRGDDAGQ